MARRYLAQLRELVATRRRIHHQLQELRLRRATAFHDLLLIALGLCKRAQLAAERALLVGDRH